MYKARAAKYFSDYRLTSRAATAYRHAPYHTRGRGSARPHTPHRHRTLVLNGTGGGAQSSNAGAGESSVATDSSGSWVSRNDRHLQLINSAVYEKDSQSRTKAIEETRKAKLRQRNEREKAKLANFFSHQAMADAAAFANLPGNSGKYEVEVEGIRFRVAKDGSKLIKLPGTSDYFQRLPVLNSIKVHLGDFNTGTTTPKLAIVGGVRFYRSKNGNLYRDGVLKAHRYGPFPTQLMVILSDKYNA
jgi:hypothetical protein